METQKNNSAKFAFFYILSLIALVFVAISAGMIIFQVINKEILDILNEYSGRYSDNQMRFAISAIVISTPIYYITAKQIYKNLFTGELNKESGIRKWLTYLILLVAIIVMISWLIAILNGFLGGELTAKFILKAVTALVIAGIVFSFYLYDIKRDRVEGYKDKVVGIYFWASLVLIIAIFVTALFNVDSPGLSRNRKIDEQIVNNLQQIDSGVYDYYHNNEKLPATLEELRAEFKYIADDEIVNPVDKVEYEYKVIDEDEYEVCTTFLTSNMDEEDFTGRFTTHDKAWWHEEGYQCIKQRVIVKDLEPVRIQ